MEMCLMKRNQIEVLYENRERYNMTRKTPLNRGIDRRDKYFASIRLHYDAIKKIICKAHNVI